MSNTNAYIVFEADQVLTNDHLNNLFSYLDTQQRFTRNKLIGMGVVCGLDLDYQGSSILVSKGCGITSKGYLALQDAVSLTQYVSYTVPALPLYKPFIKDATGTQFKLWRLLSDEEAKKVEGVKHQITQPSGFLNSKIVLLFLEANEIDLKNCDTQDCNEKGRQMEFALRTLLIEKADMEEIILKQKKLSGEASLSDSHIERLGLRNVLLKRFDVKATALTDAFDIYNAYLKCIDDATLQDLADVYSQCYSIFKPVLQDYGNDNPFKNLKAELRSKLETVKKSLPVYIQYYYDFIDDLIKAYDEFRERSFDVVTECCSDEDFFPMHLMLGEATVDTKDYVRSPFRQYFISSPLFNHQNHLLSEIKMLFERMVRLVKEFFISQSNPRLPLPVRITPSQWAQAPLSARAIPFYYNLNNIARSWSPLKTSKGKSNHNLSYHALNYNPAPSDHVVNPLLYGVEAYDFYRIEGHIGQSYTNALNAVLFQRNTYRLPFDVIALKAGTDGDDTPVKYSCHFEDIETAFSMIKAELACKVHEPVCLVAGMPLTLKVSTAPADHFKILDLISFSHELAMKEKVERPVMIETSFLQRFRFTRKGDFLKTYCPVKAGTLGFEYTNSFNRFYPRPSSIDVTTLAGSKAAFMHLIDIIEGLMQTISAASTIYSFIFSSFNKLYSLVVSYFTDLMKAIVAAEGQERKLNPLFYGMLEAVVSSCIDERLKSLTDEYAKRVEKVQKQNLLSEYLKSHPGIDHKAGVPRGGTFVMVYHEAPPEKDRAVINRVSESLTDLSFVGERNADTPARRLADTTAISGSNVNRLLKMFDTKDLALNERQTDELKKMVLKRFGDVQGERDPFTIADQTVVADFYLPYLCCSDCPPVTYVLPKEEKPTPDVLSIGLNKTEFCDIDASAYKITVSPQGGTLSASAGGVDNDKQEFRPKDVAAGINKITYTLPDGRSTSVDVVITKSFLVDFTIEPTANDSFTFKFVPTGTINKPVSWNFGDGTNASVDQSPEHTYSINSDEQSFVVKLTVSEGPCIITKEHSVTVKKPKPQIFNIRPQVFCFRDDRFFPFVVDPAVNDIAEINNPDNLILTKDAAGALRVRPSDHQLQQTKTFNLTLKGIALSIKMIVPDAGFTMNIERSNVVVRVPDTVLTLRAKQTDADEYNWVVTAVTGAVHQFTGREVKLFYNQLQIPVGPQLSIVLSVSYKNQTGVNCADKKDYNITELIFRKHLNRGEFDNVTPL